MDALKLSQLAELKRRFAIIVLDVLGPVRLRKEVSRDAMTELMSILDELRPVLGTEEYVPRTFVGELLFVVTSLFAEAAHAKDPTPIVTEAWAVIERLERIFGPEW